MPPPCNGPAGNRSDNPLTKPAQITSARTLPTPCWRAARAARAAPPTSPGEVFLPELRDATRRRRPRLGFLPAQFHPPDLAGDRLRQVAELHPPDPLVRRHPLPAEGHDRLRELRRSHTTRGQQHV